MTYVHASIEVDPEEAETVAAAIRDTFGGEVRVSERRRALPELWGARQTAEYLGVRMSNLYKVSGLPEPAIELERGRLWRADEIRKFAKTR